MATPQITQDPLYILLREEKIDAFNQARAEGKTCSLTGCDFRGLDLRELNVDGLDLSSSYFRGTDLRGLDFRKSNLEGASLATANISGCYFPNELSADEIVMSVQHGTRLRYGS